MKQFLRNLYKSLYKEELIVNAPCPVSPTPVKTKNQQLLDIALLLFDTDPTPNDEQSDDFACVHSLTTIVKKLYIDFPVMTYTPVLLKYLQNDKRFKPSNEFKEGNIIVSPTNSGNGSVVGHTGIISHNGEILSNSSATGLWLNKFNNISWIERYSSKGQLDLYIFELI